MRNLLRSLCEWTISKENQELLKETWVIDFHSHIWNILERKPEQVFDESIKFPIDVRTIASKISKFKSPWKITQAMLHIDIIDNILRESWKNRNSSATLETFKKSMDRSFTSKAVILPIPPYQTFDDLKEIQENDDRMILFTWVDFDKLNNLSISNWFNILEELEKQFENDVKNWAKGLKIHPIIQWISADSVIVDEVVRLWQKYDLPIIFHTWVTEYCKKSENCNHMKPEYWEIKYFINLAKKHPEAKIVIGHSWLFQVDDVINYLSKYDNVVVDTSFQWKEKILGLINNFWIDRVMYASDWPYWDRIPAINVMLETLGWDRILIEKVMRDNALYQMNMK